MTTSTLYHNECYGLLTAVIINTQMDDLPKLWTSIRADLHRACNLLPGSSEDSGSLRQYHEFVEHNELELACDALEESAKDRAVSSDFWLALRDAAQKMRLVENAARYEKLANLGF
jgi:hypothetical protein